MNEFYLHVFPVEILLRFRTNRRRKMSNVLHLQTTNSKYPLLAYAPQSRKHRLCPLMAFVGPTSQRSGNGAFPLFFIVKFIHHMVAIISIVITTLFVLAHLDINGSTSLICGGRSFILSSGPDAQSAAVTLDLLQVTIILFPFPKSVILVGVRCSRNFHFSDF